MTSSCITNIRQASTFLVIHTVYVLTINMLSNKCTPWYTTYGIRQLLHVSASRCHLQGVIITKAHKPTCQYFSAPYTNNSDVKILKDIKLIELILAFLDLHHSKEQQNIYWHVGLYTFVTMTPWRWHLDVETCGSRGMS